MPANFASGMFVHDPAWHGLGTVVDNYPQDWPEARKLAGLEWEPLVVPAYGFQGLTKDGKMTFDPAQAVAGDYIEMPENSRVVRSDTGYQLGVPSKEFPIISHDDVGMILDALTQSGKSLKAKTKYETVVGLEGGRKVAVLVRLDEPVKIAGDPSKTYPFIVLTIRHDGTGACRAQATTIRVVCMNTFSAAEAQADANDAVFVFRHSANWKDRLEEARETILGLRKRTEEYEEFANHLVKVRWHDENTAMFLERFLPMQAVEMTERVQQNILDARATVKGILASITCEGIRGTAFGPVQAAGEYLDQFRGLDKHGEPRNLESRFRRQLIGSETRKSEAVKIVGDIIGENLIPALAAAN